ncbi:hypothetical protein D046_0107B, partial [Vibrio parahaemolyticus V-223/04]
SYLLAE